jgi:hypothetical protein
MTQKIELGAVLRIRALRWDDGWEFDCPVVILDPVIRVYEDGRSLDRAIEDLLIDACIDGKISDHEAWRWKDAPGGARGYLRRKFYRKYVQRAVVDVRFIHDEDGQLSWEELPAPEQPEMHGGAL